MDRAPERDRERDLAWLAARLQVPVERIVGTATWRSYPGSGDSLDLIELLFSVERELDASEGRRP